MCRINILIFALCTILAFSGCGRDKAILIDSQNDKDTTVESIEESLQESITDISSENEEKNIEEIKLINDNINQEIAVYVCGAVLNEGVYYLPSGSIKMDALNLAGGFLPEASTSYVNLAEKVEEGEKIYIPYEDEVDTSLYKEDLGGQENAETSGKININKATVDELTNLPGIGKSRAEAIVEYRNSCGTFASIEDIKLVSGIKSGVYDQIKEYICVN